MALITGRCLCGDVAISLAKPPQRATLCSCRYCQRTTGAAQAVIHIVPLEDMTVTRGNAVTHSHVSASSGHLVNRHFCARCASTVFITFGRWPDMAGLPHGTFDDMAQVPVNPAAAKQIFVADAPPDLVLRADIPAFWHHAAGLDGTPCAPIMLDAPTAVRDLPR